MPADDAGWAALVGDLYGRRTAAFTAVDPGALTAVYAPGSPLLSRDAAQLTALRDAGQVVDGFDPRLREVVSVAVESPERARVVLVDALPDYRTGTPDAGTGDLADGVRRVPGRPDARVQLVLARSDDGWRIAEAGLVGG